MKKIGKYSIITFSILLGLIMVGSIFKKISFLEVKEAFKNATILVTCGFIAVSILMMVLLSYRWKFIISTKKNVSLWKIFQYKIVGYGISFITPAAKVGGEPLRAMLLQREGFTFKEGFSTVAIDKIIDLTTSGFLFIIGVLVAISSFALPSKATILLIVFAVIIIAIIIWFYFMLISDKNVLSSIFKFMRLDKIKKLKKFESNIVDMDILLVSFYKNNKKTFNKTIFISIASWLLMFVEYTLALMLVGINAISFGGLFLIITMIGATYLIPVPLALGVSEAGQISVFSLLNLNSAAGVGLATIIRARDFSWTLIGIGILLTKGMNVRKAYDKSIKEGGINPPLTIKSNNKKKSK